MIFPSREILSGIDRTIVFAGRPGAVSQAPSAGKWLNGIGSTAMVSFLSIGGSGLLSARDGQPVETSDTFGGRRRCRVRVVSDQLQRQHRGIDRGVTAIRKYDQLADFCR